MLNIKIQYTFTTILQKLPTFILFDSFTPYQMCIKLVNLLLCHIALVWLTDDDPLWVETYRNIPCVIIIHVSYLREKLVHFVGWELQICYGKSTFIKFPKNTLRASNEIYACYWKYYFFSTRTYYNFVFRNWTCFFSKLPLEFPGFYIFPVEYL